jgi:hypothetical protein
MIRMQVSERMLKEAEELFQPMLKLPRSEPMPLERRMIGALGEIAVIDYCWSNNLLAFKNTQLISDLKLYSGHTIEVKTQKVTTEPQEHYRVLMESRCEQTEISDFLFFTHLQYVAGKPEAVWLIGGCSWDKFWRLSQKHLQGSPMMKHYADGNEVANGRYFTYDTNLMPISQLAPPSAALKHFKSLQEKEEAK